MTLGTAQWAAFAILAMFENNVSFSAASAVFPPLPSLLSGGSREDWLAYCALSGYIVTFTLKLWLFFVAIRLSLDCFPEIVVLLLPTLLASGSGSGTGIGTVYLINQVLAGNENIDWVFSGISICRLRFQN